MKSAGPLLPIDDSGWTTYFDTYAPRYEASAFGGAGLAYVGNQEVAAILEALATRDSGHVLDAGAGAGRLSGALVRAGWNVTALDASAEMRALLAQNVPDAHVVTGALGTALALDDCSFDAVVSLRVLKYVHDLPLALSEFARVLRPGGIAMLEVANRRSLARFGYSGAPIHFVTIAEFERIMRSAGLEPIARHAGTRLPQPVWSLARTRTSCRAAVAVDRALGSVVGGDRTAAAARSVMICGLRRDAG